MARKDMFTGRSGQLAVMAEFLHRQLNVAIPEVDVGDDIVVVRDDNDQVTRVQVKTANAVEQFGQQEDGLERLRGGQTVQLSGACAGMCVARTPGEQG